MSVMDGGGRNLTDRFSTNWSFPELCDRELRISPPGSNTQHVRFKPPRTTHSTEFAHPLSRGAEKRVFYSFMKLPNLISACFLGGERKSRTSRPEEAPSSIPEKSTCEEIGTAVVGDCLTGRRQNSSIPAVTDEEWSFEDQVPSSCPPLQDDTATRGPNKNVECSSCGESCLPAGCLEMIVSDVLNWKTQINALLSYVSIQSNGHFEGSSDKFRLKIDALLKENKELIGKLDDISKDKLRAEDVIEEVKEELDQLRSNNIEKDRQLREMHRKHQEEMQLLKEQILQTKKRDHLLKKILNQNTIDSETEDTPLRRRRRSISSRESILSSCAPNTPDLPSPFRKIASGLSEDDYEMNIGGCTSPDSAYLKSQIFKLQDSIRSLESQIDSKHGSSSSSRLSLKLHHSLDSNDAQHLHSGSTASMHRYGDESRIPKPAKNRPTSACSVGNINRTAIPSSLHLKCFSTISSSQTKHLSTSSSSSRLRRTPSRFKSCAGMTDPNLTESQSSASPFSSLPEILERSSWRA